MSRPARERVREQLERQIDQLGALRSANTRDPNFKEWRQSTLTLIQRLWPGEPARSERFRRVPFSPPSSRATAEAMREIYERGCAEAGALLKSMLTEVEYDGVPPPAQAEPPPPSQVEDDVPLLDLPGQGAAPPSPPPPPGMPLGPPVELPPVSAPPVERPSIPHQMPLDPPDDVFSSHSPIELPTVMATPLPPEPPPAPVVQGPPALVATPRLEVEPPLIVTPSRVVEPPLEMEPPLPVTPPRIVEPPPPPVVQERPPAPAPPPRPRPKSVKQALKDMLGFSDHPAEPPPMGKITIGGSAKRPAPPPAPVQPPAPPPTPQEPGRVVIQQSRTPAPAQPAPTHEERFGAEEAAHATQEFLRTSPVLSSSAKPFERPQPAAPPPPPASESPRTPAAASLIALAGEIAHLGVPDGQRAVARAMLLELAQQLDRQQLSWDTLRRSMTFIMEHPPLARRVVPLLIPYLDRAA